MGGVPFCDGAGCCCIGQGAGTAGVLMEGGWDDGFAVAALFVCGWLAGCAEEAGGDGIARDPNMASPEVQFSFPALLQSAKVDGELTLLPRRLDWQSLRRLGFDLLFGAILLLTEQLVTRLLSSRQLRRFLLFGHGY